MNSPELQSCLRCALQTKLLLTGTSKSFFCVFFLSVACLCKTNTESLVADSATELCLPSYPRLENRTKIVPRASWGQVHCSLCKHNSTSDSSHLHNCINCSAWHNFNQFCSSWWILTNLLSPKMDRGAINLADSHTARPH